MVVAEPGAEPRASASGQHGLSYAALPSTAALQRKLAEGRRGF